MSCAGPSQPWEAAEIQAPRLRAAEPGELALDRVGIARKGAVPALGLRLQA